MADGPLVGLGFAALLVCAVAAAVVVAEWRFGRRIQRQLRSQPCPACDAGPLAVTANPVWPEQASYHCSIRVWGRYVCCKACGAAYFTAPVGTFRDGIVTTAAHFELYPFDATELQRGILRRRGQVRRLAAILVGAGAVLGVVYAVSLLVGLPATECTLVALIVLLLFGRRLPELVGAVRRNNRAA
jgi:hypothetical protein